MDVSGRIEQVSTEEAVAMTVRMAREEGVFAGTSTGCNVIAALRLAEQLGPDAIIERDGFLVHGSRFVPLLRVVEKNAEISEQNGIIGRVPDGDTVLGFRLRIAALSRVERRQLAVTVPIFGAEIDAFLKEGFGILQAARAFVRGRERQVGICISRIEFQRGVQLLNGELRFAAAVVQPSERDIRGSKLIVQLNGEFRVIESRFQPFGVVVDAVLQAARFAQGGVGQRKARIGLDGIFEFGDGAVQAGRFVVPGQVAGAFHVGFVVGWNSAGAR